MTSERIYQALISSLTKKPFDKLSVSEIVNVAEVGRSSFYRNFDSLIDVLTWKCDLSFADVIKGYLSRSHNENEGMLNYVFSYWSSHSEVLETLLSIKRMDIIYESFFNSSKGILPSQEQEYFLAVRIGIFIAVFDTWLRHDKKETPEQLSQLVNQALIQASF